MAKISKPTLYKILGATGLVSIPVATTLGVVIGTKEEKTNMGKTEAVSFGDKFFDQQMSEGTSSFAQRQLLTPYRPLTGGGNLSELVRLDFDFDSTGAHRMLAVDSDNKEKPALGMVKIEVKNILNQDQLSDAFLKANVELKKVAEANKGKPLGIYIGKDLRTREVTASIYEVKGVSSDEKAKLDKLLSDMGMGAGINTNGLKPTKFLQIFGSQNTLRPDQTEYFNVDYKGQSERDFENPLNTEYGRVGLNGSISATEDPTLYNDSWHKWQIDKGLKPSEHFKISGTRKKSGHILLTKLIEQNLIPTYETAVDWKNNEAIYIFRLWKTDGNSSVSFDLGDRVRNSIGQYTRIMRVPFSSIVSHTPTIDTTQRAHARSTIKKFLSKDIPRYAKNAIVKNGLPIMGNIIPSLSDALSKIVEVGELLAYDIATPADYASATGIDNPNIPTYVFNPHRDEQKWHKFVLQEEVIKDDFLDKIIDRLLSDTSIDFGGVIDLMEHFEDDAFNGSEPYWTSINKLQSMYTTGKTPTDKSGQYNLYQITSFFNSTFKMIEDKMKENPAYAAVKADRIDSSLIEKLLNYLKHNGVVSKEYTLGDLMGNPIEEVYKILSSIAKKQIQLPEDIIRGALPLVPVSLVSDHLDGIVKAIAYATSGGNLESILKLLGDNDTTRLKTVKDLITPASSDDRWDAVERITQNTHASLESIQNLFMTIKLTGILPESLNFLLGDTHDSAETYSKLFANGGTHDIFALVKQIFDDGLFKMVGDTWVEGVDTDLTHVLTAADKTKIKTWFSGLTQLQQGLITQTYDNGHPFSFNIIPTETLAQQKQKIKDALKNLDKQWFKDTMMFMKPKDQEYPLTFDQFVGTSTTPGAFDGITDPTMFAGFVQVLENALIVSNNGGYTPKTKVLAWIDSFTKSKDLKDVLIATPIINDFTSKTQIIIEKLVSVIKVKGMDLSKAGQLVGAFIPPLLSTINTLLSKPIISREEKFGLYNQIVNDGEAAKLYGLIQPMIAKAMPSITLPSIDQIKMFVNLVVGAGNEGLTPFLDTTATQNGLTRLDATKQVIDTVLSTIFPSGYAKGNADSPAGESWTNDQLSGLVNGLLNGFASADELVASLRTVLSDDTMNYEIPTIGGTVADIFKNIYNSKKLLSVWWGGMAEGALLKGDILGPLQKVFKKGLLSLSKADFKGLLTSLKQTFDQSLFTTNGIDKDLIITHIKVDIPFMGTIKAAANKFDDKTADTLAQALIDVLHNPLKDITGNKIDDVIKLINSLGILKTPLPMIGGAIHTALNDGISSVTPIDAQSIAHLAGLSDSITEIITKALFGMNYKQHTIDDMKLKISALTKPADVALTTGVTLPASTESYASLSTLYDAKLIAANNFELSLEEINANYRALLKAKVDLDAYIAKVNRANKDFADKKVAINAMTLPVEVTLTAGKDATPLKGRTYAALKTQFDAELAKVATASMADLSTIETKINELIAKANKLNEDIGKLNRGESLGFTTIQEVKVYLEAVSSVVKSDIMERTGGYLSPKTKTGVEYTISSEADLQKVCDDGLKIFVNPSANWSSPFDNAKLSFDTTVGLVSKSPTEIFKLIKSAYANKLVIIIKNDGTYKIRQAS